ncbi:28S ribosomal protein S6, mitochondrial-like isoform X2 [Lytechinus variegatus]|uniref:28S ribosomal protein S6, mitochondrial-like isoform X2 n=1 Tax=Lytechinus variegatus TaxID=7654 RepID=UPI001BB1EDE2|nr:28S ribosomal protein S6, mitochondrial-like isoform X2 [Lytechinus variegatus]
MPGYEVSLIMRVMRRPEMVDALKRSLTQVMENGGIVRKIENLGEKQLPYRIRAHRQNFSYGQYFVVDFDGPPTVIEPLNEYFRRDIDIIRPSILNRASEQWPEDMVCEGPHDERYNPMVKNLKKLKVNVLQELEDANVKLS